MKTGPLANRHAISTSRVPDKTKESDSAPYQAYNQISESDSALDKSSTYFARFTKAC